MKRREAIEKVNWIIASAFLGCNVLLESGFTPKSVDISRKYRPGKNKLSIYRAPVDLKEMAVLALHHYSHMLDDNNHHLPYFYVKLDQKESYASHSEWDFGDATGRYLDSVILCQSVTGKKTERTTEGKLKDALRWMRSDQDGLFYRKANAWVEKSAAGMFDQRSALLGLISWYTEQRDEEPKRYINQLIQTLKRIGVEKEDYICFPFDLYVPGMPIPEKIFNEHGFIVDPCTYGGGVLILPLTLYYQETGDKDALDLIEKLTRFIIKHARVYQPDGSFWSRARYEDDGHFHSHMSTVVGILRFATVRSNPALVDWCYNVYNWACTMGSTYGWFPEGTGLNGKEPVDEKYRWLPGIIQHSETCATTDMIHSAIYLAKNGKRSLWDHAERYFNVLTASQIKSSSWAKTVTDKAETPVISYRDIPQRYIGGFTGRMNPNDFTNDGFVDTMACCCGSGGRGIYLLWSNALENKVDEVVVNLWFNRENDYIKLEMAIPERGSMKITVKKDCTLNVRLPDWLNRNSIQVSDGNKQLLFTISDDHLRFERLQRLSSVQIDFALENRAVTEVVAGREYSITWRGNYVIAIDPKGKHMPLDSML
ncbi:MAG TPA: hypothetical protein VIM16_00965 [Mucilaginibacter sp.]|jgi:hypothetical protein